MKEIYNRDVSIGYSLTPIDVDAYINVKEATPLLLTTNEEDMEYKFITKPYTKSLELTDEDVFISLFTIAVIEDDKYKVTLTRLGRALSTEYDFVTLNDNGCNNANRANMLIFDMQKTITDSKVAKVMKKDTEGLKRVVRNVVLNSDFEHSSFNAGTVELLHLYGYTPIEAKKDLLQEFGNTIDIKFTLVEPCLNVTKDNG